MAPRWSGGRNRGIPWHQTAALHDGEQESPIGDIPGTSGYQGAARYARLAPQAACRTIGTRVAAFTNSYEGATRAHHVPEWT